MNELDEGPVRISGVPPKFSETLQRNKCRVHDILRFENKIVQTATIGGLQILNLDTLEHQFFTYSSLGWVEKLIDRVWCRGLAVYNYNYFLGFSVMRNKPSYLSRRIGHQSHIQVVKIVEDRIKVIDRIKLYNFTKETVKSVYAIGTI